MTPDAAQPAGGVICVGLRRWKAFNLRPMLGPDPRQVRCVSGVDALLAAPPAAGDALMCWGAQAPEGLAALAQRHGAEVWQMEDGFLRSVGLGSDLIRPLSLVLDRRGIYFDPSRPSDLEHLLNTAEFTDDDRDRAARVRAYVVEHGLTKYNLEPRQPARWPSGGRQVLLVPGQVEDDASIRLGCTGVRTNLQLLQAARAARPGAFIVYKPHPDVMSGNRTGRMALQAARGLADHVETQLSVVSCIEACDEVHTMTSLTGFDALLRLKSVVTYGQPFYAGWGLTRDTVQNGAAFARRVRRLGLDELVAGTLLHYPLYWDWDRRCPTSCEAVMQQLVQTRDRLEADGGLERLRRGGFRRLGRKLKVLLQAILIA